MDSEDKKVILIDIQVNEGQTQEAVDKLSKSITVLKAENKDLINVNKTLESEGKVLTNQYVENTKTILSNQESIKQNTSERKLLIQSLGAENNSIEALKISNKQLTEERLKLNLSTKEGQTRLAEINDKLSDNKDKLKEVSEATTKSTSAWGSFKDGLDKAVPGLGGLISGIESGTKAALAFIATPLGAVLAAIGIALSSLIAYFKSSEEGQNRLNAIMLVGKTIIEQFKNFFEDFGEAVYNAFTDPKKAMEDFVGFLKDQLINRFVGMLELIPKLGVAISLLFEGKFSEAGKVAVDAVGKVTLGIEHASDKLIAFTEKITQAVNTGIEQGNRLAKIQAELDVNERSLIVERERIRIEVDKKREDALVQERDQRKETIGEAIMLIQSLSDKELRQSQLRLEQAKLELKANGDDKEAKLKVAEATASVIRAEAIRYEEAFKLRKQFEALDAKELADKKKLESDKLKAERDAFDKSWDEEVSRRAAENAERDKQADLELKRVQQEELTKQKLHEQTTLGAINQLGILTKNQQTARAVGNALFKQDAIKQIFSDTRKGAMGAYSALASIPIVGPVLGAIAAGAVIAFGAVQEAAVAGLSFARGGSVPSKSSWFGTVGGKSHSEGGTKYYGDDGMVIEFEKDEGLFVLNKTAHRSFINEMSMRNQLEGNGVPWTSNPIKNMFASGGEVLSSNADRTISNDRQLRQIADLILNQPRKVVVVEDINSLQAQQVDIRETASF